jgi:IS605 OrfB family transposase
MKTGMVRTDKWELNPSAEAKSALRLTVSVFRAYVRSLTGIIYTHWDVLGALTQKEQVPSVEKLMHRTAQHPDPKYASYFERRFPKFPSYYRRSAIAFCLGQVSSFVTRYAQCQSGIRKRRDASPPRLTANAGVYPALYKGQCIRYGNDAVEIKVFYQNDWIWVSVPLGKQGKRHQLETHKQGSPSLIANHKSIHLSVPFEVKPDKQYGNKEIVVGVDLGINTTATVAVVDSIGTVIHREFLHCGRDIDRRDQRLQRIRANAKKTKTLYKGFCKSLHRKCANINKQIAHIVSKRIVMIAQQFNAKTIVFERLKGWKPRAGRKGTTLRQRFHGWLHRMTANFTEQKFREIGGTVAYVLPKYTSAYAYDGSGKTKRPNHNKALAYFTSGKCYNADLSAAYNIAARYFHKLVRRNGNEVFLDRSIQGTPRIPVTLSELWRLHAAMLPQKDTPTTAVG